ncbi:sterol desaturase family protein [Methylotenera sp.]|uniref:sterol desaturase family protein n=1 Tax=Methylotenera sp. TaxID=2051956 RepID=UPI0027351002|nr:sterol desaturase family protein [Methylotenera sp.]MDP3004637.1 sterol desaturase family protein [Methylotenera sp.]
MEAYWRFGIFLSVYLLAALLESFFPKRPPTQPRIGRWVINFSLVGINILAQRFTLGAAAYLTAVYAQDHGWGLMSVLNLPFWAEALIAFLILDFAIYLQHVMSHALPIFWRLHSVHHADLDIDASSGLRFHPIEIVISILYKSVIVAALGADPWVVIAFEATLNGAAVFTHANISYPDKLDWILRLLICTPNMHRVHHSTARDEMDTNFGFFLSIWDRIGGTYHHAPPRAGHEHMELGLPYIRQQSRLGLMQLLWLPFRVTRQTASLGLSPDVVDGEVKNQ